MASKQTRSMRIKVMLAAVAGAVSGAVRAGLDWLLEQVPPTC